MTNIVLSFLLFFGLLITDYCVLPARAAEKTLQNANCPNHAGVHRTITEQMHGDRASVDGVVCTGGGAGAVPTRGYPSVPLNAPDGYAGAGAVPALGYPGMNTITAAGGGGGGSSGKPSAYGTAENGGFESFGLTAAGTDHAAPLPDLSGPVAWLVALATAAILIIKRNAYE